jgi:molybdopterin converting factor small subunit
VPRVKFTRHLRRFFPDLDDVQVEGETVADVIAALNQRYPGLADYIIDERGRLRQHVNIFIGDVLIRDRERLEDPVTEADQLFVLQALSGG